MSEAEFNIVFSKRLKYYLAKYNMTQLDLAKKLNVGTTTVSNWCNGLKSPRMGKVDAMCEIFHCKRSDLMEERPEQYYIEEDAKEMAEFMFKNPEYKVLFKASQKVRKEDIQLVAELLERFKKE